MRIGIGLFLLFTLMACSAPDQTPTAGSVATSTLIAPTMTPTPLPPTATPTESNLPAPQDLATAVTGNASSGTPAPVDSEVTGTGLVDRDPIAAELVRLAQEAVRRETDLPTRRIQLVEIRSMVWTDSSMNCPLPDSTYVPLEIDGYRIVLSAGEQEYVFHTDIDRVMLCDPENEQLPGAEAMAEATEEPTETAEATQELTS